MSRREDIKKVDISLSESMYKASRKAINGRAFSLKLRLAAKRLTDAFRDSPEGVTKRVRQRLPELSEPGRGAMAKRISVEFPVDHLREIDQATAYFLKRGLELHRQDVLKFALLEWPNPE